VKSIDENFIKHANLLNMFGNVMARKKHRLSDA
jgi:hypothetical protein